MEMTYELMKRFCRDYKVPISIYEEPIFSDRINVLDKYYGTKEKLNVFMKTVDKFPSEQEYLEYYNAVKEQAINRIKESEEYKKFLADDMKKYQCKNLHFPGKDIYKPMNDGRAFISIDISKANFSALKAYDKNFFEGKDTWEDFLSQFTKEEYILDSKYIRQVVMGTCNPKRQITYEKYITDHALSVLLSNGIKEKEVVFFSNDEIVLDVTELENCPKMVDRIYEMLNDEPVSFKVEFFKLYQIHGTEGYLKKIYIDGETTKAKLTCVDSFIVPFIVKYLEGKPVTKMDRLFYHNGLLSEYLETPEISVNIK